MLRTAWTRIPYYLYNLTDPGNSRLILVDPSLVGLIPSAGRRVFVLECPLSPQECLPIDIPCTPQILPWPPNTFLLEYTNSHKINGPDFISRGIIHLAEAEYLFDYFQCRINPFLWDGILCAHKTLGEARQSSSLLVATALTVAALHIPNREESLRATYDAFVSVMRASCLLRNQNLDDVRGLCIGAFYLTNLSWALCTRAVRVATEMNLHKSSL
jgi:hypothetical protein